MAESKRKRKKTGFRTNCSPVFQMRDISFDFHWHRNRAGLGHTVPLLDVAHHKVFPKTSFSMLVPDVQEELEKHKDIKSVVLCGIETHVCIQQTVLDLLENDYDVHVVVDACSSRSQVDRMYGFQRIQQSGAYLTTSESILLGLVQDSSNPRFKSIKKLIMDVAPDSGLLPGVDESSV